VSVRRLLGWEPAEVTTYEYDDDGRVVRAVTVREPEYSDLDRKWLLRSREVENEPRGPHGVPISLATDPANRGKFSVPPPSVDFAAWEMSKARAVAEKTYKDKIPMDALRFEVQMRD
jgi:hypothetical protein